MAETDDDECANSRLASSVTRLSIRRLGEAPATVLQARSKVFTDKPSLLA